MLKIMLTLNLSHSKRSVLYTNRILFKRFRYQFASKRATKELYEILGVAEDCKNETLRLAFVHLAKRFHPDSGIQEADTVRFSQIENAYREICKIRNIQKNEKVSSANEEFDIRHTVPQHRHYLTFNVGIGTPNKRQKLYTMQRTQKAIDNVMEHRLKKIQAEERNALIGIDKQKAKDIKIHYGMDRLVEDLIQEAMNKGEFNDLPGMGKPLNATSVRNPYVDFITHKLNQIMIDNGFIPEWIQLSKEIIEETDELKRKLSEIRNNIGVLPLNSKDRLIWENNMKKFKNSTVQINNKIDKYNLLVPMLQKQMLHVNLNKFAEEALSVLPIKNIKKSLDSNYENLNQNISQDLFAFISNLFNRKII